jgi:phage protein D
MRYSDIVKEITDNIKIKFEPLPQYGAIEEKCKFIFQNNMYDIVFLMEIARTIGYEIYVEAKKTNGEYEFKFYFRPSIMGKKVYLLEWGKSLINFHPNLTTVNQVSEVVVTGWNPTQKKRVVGTAKRKDLETQALGVDKDIQVIESSLTQKVERIADIPVYDTQEANQLAKETLKKMTKGMVKASGSTVGLPNLRAGTTIDIIKLGELFSGTYYVTETTHTINDSGYITNFSARKEEKKTG